MVSKCLYYNSLMNKKYEYNKSLQRTLLCIKFLQTKPISSAEVKLLGQYVSTFENLHTQGKTGSPKELVTELRGSS